MRGVSAREKNSLRLRGGSGSLGALLGMRAVTSPAGPRRGAAGAGPAGPAGAGGGRRAPPPRRGPRAPPPRRGPRAPAAGRGEGGGRCVGRRRGKNGVRAVDAAAALLLRRLLLLAAAPARRGPSPGPLVARRLTPAPRSVSGRSWGEPAEFRAFAEEFRELERRQDALFGDAWFAEGRQALERGDRLLREPAGAEVRAGPFGFRTREGGAGSLTAMPDPTRRRSQGARLGQAPARAYRRERESRSEEELAGGGFRRSYFAESVTVYGGGAPPAAAPPAPGPSVFLGLALALGAAYAAGAYALNRAFDRTSYGAGSRGRLPALWPLLATDPGFRRQFRAAFRRRPEGDRHRGGGGGGGGGPPVAGPG